MDLENYRNFLAVIETGSLTGAAEYVHVAQPALSKQIRALENFYDAKLLITERGSRKVILTEAGRLLYQKAKYICSLEDLAKEEIISTQRGAAGTLRISVANSRSASFVKNSLRPFSELYPEVSFEIFETSFYEQSQQLLNGITEIGVLSTPIGQEDNFEELFRRDEYLAAVFRDGSQWHGNSRRKGLNLSDLRNVPLCVSSGCHAILRKACDKIGFHPKILSINTTRHTALQWVLADCGAAVVPVEPGEELGEAYHIKKILDVDTELYKSVVKVKGRPLSPLALKFIQFYNENSNSRRLCDMRRLETESRI
ncbi:MAG: LysR family transcriptional regulator [Acidaminococcaceae bacterium]|nr:LysR family transcriptional regulator [Acidaminococcaceae bacterium]MBQ9697141.1 LysR family transcriptional regulator [Acidaminococcaceae bacterium]MBR1511501.1 LysR family transcriptional regulator [Acidaminococcaceae bacterium]MBR1590254.1 LysR family transcriptional regulator [Acidaminococcaceae bacterium]MBR1662359.1 LysR family transcriptional regulator [Acidaminococcaceae bacterium]